AEPGGEAGVEEAERVGELDAGDEAQVAAAAVPDRGGVGLADAVDDEHGGALVGRDEQGAGGVALVVVEADDALARDAEALGEVIEDPELAAGLAGEGAGEGAPGARQVAQEVDEGALQLGERLLVEGDGVEVGGLEAGVLEAGEGGGEREPG